MFDEEEGAVQGMEILDGSRAIQAADRAQIDIQIATARAYPRLIVECQREAMALATQDEATADSMFYAIPRGKKTVEGPTVRLAEVIAYCWGHIRVDARIEAVEEWFVVATATCIDLQKNVAVRTAVRRRITDSNGKRYNEDMILVTCNAALSIAARNALFKVVPFALVRAIYEQAKRVAVGDAKSFVKNRDAILRNLSRAGVPTQKVLDYFTYPDENSITIDDLVLLKGAFNAIREGSVTVEDAFESGKPLPTANARVFVAQGGPGAGAPPAAGEVKPAETAPDGSGAANAEEAGASHADAAEEGAATGAAQQQATEEPTQQQKPAVEIVSQTDVQAIEFNFGANVAEAKPEPEPEKKSTRRTSGPSYRQ